jgi:chromosome condensin MukBEF MukE localization factor
VHVNDIPFEEMIGCNSNQFADDTGIQGSGKDTRTVAANVQSSLNKMKVWCRKWRVNLSPSKAKVIIFTKCKTHKNSIPSLKLFDEQLTFVDEATFLGVTFNSSLTWEPQIQKLIVKVHPRLNLLIAMASYSRSHNSDMLLQLYKAILFQSPIF